MPEKPVLPVTLQVLKDMWDEMAVGQKPKPDPDYGDAGIDG